MHPDKLVVKVSFQIKHIQRNIYKVHVLIFSAFNPLSRRRNRRHFEDDAFKCIWWNENLCISIKISLKFVFRHPINIQALVQIMAWRRPVNKPLSEPMMVSLVTHICVTRPQWVKPKVNLTGTEAIIQFATANDIALTKVDEVVARIQNKLKLQLNLRKSYLHMISWQLLSGTPIDHNTMTLNAFWIGGSLCVESISLST